MAQHSLRRFSRRRHNFITEFFRSGGNATEAAIAAGYAPSSAGVMGCQLLRDDRVLEYILLEVERGRPGGNEVMRRLLLPSRPARERVRVEMLAARHAPGAKIVAFKSDRPVALVDKSAKAALDDALRFADLLDGLAGDDRSAAAHVLDGLDSGPLGTNFGTKPAPPIKNP